MVLLLFCCFSCCFCCFLSSSKCLRVSCFNVIIQPCELSDRKQNVAWIVHAIVAGLKELDLTGNLLSDWRVMHCFSEWSQIIFCLIVIRSSLWSILYLLTVYPTFWFSLYPILWWFLFVMWIKKLIWPPDILFKEGKLFW